jgi:L-histidine N-alpha-methyltransferase
MAAEVRAGLSAQPLPWLPSKYFYDDRGSALFEQITRLPEYYPTRTEEGILERVAGEIVAATRPVELCELGSGVGRKVRILLDAGRALGTLSRCLLLDINATVLAESVRNLEGDYPGLRVRGVVGDFQSDLAVLGPGGGRLALLWPAPSATCTLTAKCPGSCTPWRASSLRVTRFSWGWTW